MSDLIVPKDLKKPVNYEQLILLVTVLAKRMGGRIDLTADEIRWALEEKPDMDMTADMQRLIVSIRLLPSRKTRLILDPKA